MVQLEKAMALKNYSVLKGRPVDYRLASGANPHYQVRVVDDTAEYRIAVNVQSQDGSDLEYLISSHWQHPLQDNLQELPLGIHAIQSRPNDIALDYIRGNIVDPRLFIPIPMNLPGPDNDLNEKLDHYVQRAMADENSVLYAFGETWGPENKRDKIFGFQPGAGIHDIHMNQGNDSRHRGDDGVWQDGGLIFQFPGQDQWVGILLRFQSQAWHTDDSTGHAIAIPTSGPPSDAMPAVRLSPDTLPTTDRPDGLIRIVAALVNDTKSPERETITLLNRSNREVSLSGWKIGDKQKNKMFLDGTVGPGATKTITVAAPVSLSNKGGIITLLDEHGLKVDGVSYTHSKARHAGWTLTF
jgi:uncharacterized protein YukJ